MPTSRPRRCCILHRPSHSLLLPSRRARRKKLYPGSPRRQTRSHSLQGRTSATLRLTRTIASPLQAPRTAASLAAQRAATVRVTMVRVRTAAPVMPLRCAGRAARRKTATDRSTATASKMALMPTAPATRAMPSRQQSPRPGPRQDPYREPPQDQPRDQLRDQPQDPCRDPCQGAPLPPGQVRDPAPDPTHAPTRARAASRP